MNEQMEQMPPQRITNRGVIRAGMTKPDDYVSDVHEKAWQIYEEVANSSPDLTHTVSWHDVDGVKVSTVVKKGR